MGETLMTEIKERAFYGYASNFIDGSAQEAIGVEFEIVQKEIWQLFLHRQAEETIRQKFPNDQILLALHRQFFPVTAVRNFEEGGRRTCGNDESFLSEW